MQYAAILSPAPLERKRLADLLMKHGFELVSKEPQANFDARDIRLTLFVDFSNWNTIMDTYEVYRVVGPEVRRLPFVFENTPLWVKIVYYYHYGINGLRGTLRYWWAKNISGEANVS